MAVLTAPPRMRKPTMTTKTRKATRMASGPGHVHGHAGDEVVAVDRDADGVRDDHDGKQGAYAGEDEAVDGDDDGGALEVLELGVLDLAIDLGEGLFAAHGEDGVAEGHENAEQRPKAAKKAGVSEKADGVIAEVEVGRCGPGRQMSARCEWR